MVDHQAVGYGPSALPAAEPHVKRKGKPCTHKWYRLTCEQYDALRAESEGCCQICRITPDRTGHRFLVLDHDPRIGQWAVRGLICSRCNSVRVPAADPEDEALGRYLANAWYLRVLAEYGLSTEIPPEPSDGSSIRIGRRTWTRTRSDRWRAHDSTGGYITSWEELHYRYGPHVIEVLHGPPRPVDEWQRIAEEAMLRAAELEVQNLGLRRKLQLLKENS